ncbi:repulsive guidance molecule a-like [Plakobranchus ocellatus]|uniref:Repulsive guidance molecule a-like n=1 Tax=Plakobranchus ocellatus TaxID=259542 RepID=A0AAV4E2E7_9GAST|nr:repulsive guidance molecule a-like [Plakobranchus ocellatus]
MAYGVLCFAIVHREEEVSQTTAAARGLPCPATVWKGMGPSGYHKPPTLATLSFLGYILMLSYIFISAEGALLGLGAKRDIREESGGGGRSQPEGSQTARACDLAHCSDEFGRTKEELYEKDVQLRDKDAICAMILDYSRCIKSAKGCVADLTYHTLRKVIRNDLELNDCSKEDEKEKAPRENTKRPRGPEPPPLMCTYQGPLVYRHCGLFGDPHLRTFHGDFQTCKVKGAWPLVNNDYITVQVTNDPVEGNSDVTATSKLTVIVKGNPDCTSKNFQMYQAQSDSLPGTFDDGRVHVGPYHSLELIEVDPGAHIEIHIRYINTIVVVRRIGRYLTFSIQMPESLVNGTSGVLGGNLGRGFSASAAASSSSSSQDVQLCLRGCPESELINFQEYLALRRYSVPSNSPKPPSPSDGDSFESLQGNNGIQVESVSTRAEAEEVCREASVTGFYFDFCVFDLMATGDRNFTLAAVSALQDVLRLDPSAARTMDSRTSLEKYDEQYARDSAYSSCFSVGAAWWWRTSFCGIIALFFFKGNETEFRRHRYRDVLVYITVLTFLVMLNSR